jgi:PAS domain S-box-containing protein
VPEQLNLLLIEDSEEDAELVEYELRRHGYDVTARRVASAPALREALGEAEWDLALSDHSLPGFASSEAQAIVNETLPDLPFVILSGTIGEEATVDALRSGARDVVLKGKLSRLGLVVDRVLEDAEQRRRHREAEVELAESSARKSAILDSALDCIVTIDHEGRIVDFNPAAEETFGYLQDEVRGKPMVDLIIPPSLRDRHRDGFARHLETGKSTLLGARTELTAMRADGREFPVEVAITRSSLSQNPFFTAYVRDITAAKRAQAEREQLEQQLNQARRMEAIGSLAGGVAHDFNNILTVIRAATSFLARELGDAPPAARVRQIDLAAERASELTQQLLAFSRRQVLKPESIDLNSVVDETLQMLDRVIGEHIELKARLGSPLHSILADRGQVQQVVLNLIVNARDAMPGGGMLELRTGNADRLDEPQAGGSEQEPGPFVLLEVSDTGTGMDEATRERVFDPFFTTKEDGTGLGLATVYGIVTQSGGRISVTSSPGRGTTFGVYFPASSAEVEAPPAPTAVSSLEGSETILLVEDSELVRPLVAEVLESYGYTVLTAVDGIEALAIAASHRGTIDLLLTDVVMPRMNGPELADQLLEKMPGLRVLFTSGYPAGIVGRHGIADSGAAFIQKPYVADDLAAAIRRALERGG